jgi:hypothetical protein
MEGILKINLKDVVKKPSVKCSQELSDDYIEIIHKYIKIYHGCWIKYKSKEDDNIKPGGFLIDITEDDVAVLRNIRKDVFNVNLYDNIFYVKYDTPHHKAVKEIIQEKEKLLYNIKAFNIEKQNFIQKRKNLKY